MKKTLYYSLICILLITSCKKDKTVNPITFVEGKNYKTTTIDGDTREYYVHLPSSYNKDNPTPVVFMLHGTSGDGEKFYNISGWKEVGEVENIITVYPSSWHHCIIDDGKQLNTTKWNVYPGSFDYCIGEVPRDDIKFLRKIIDELKSGLNVDSKRIYLAGFSNGGQMAFRAAVEMSDVLAAVVENAGTETKDTTYVPMRKLPVGFQLGNSDDTWLNSATAEIPMIYFDSLLMHQVAFQSIINVHANTFGFSKNYVKTGDVNTALVATFPADSPSPPREFKIVLVNELDHQYPNGTNHPMVAAAQQWAWFKQYSLP